MRYFVELEDTLNSTASSRVVELDAARGIACMLIVTFHLWPGAFFFGWSRVDFFFVLSGYLITSIVLRYQRSYNFIGIFYLRRILSTWPAYYLLILIVCVVMLCNRDHLNLVALAQYLFFFQNLSFCWSDASPSLSPLLAHLWCIAIEEQFYLIWPILIKKVYIKYLPYVVVWIMANSILFRAWGVHPWTLVARSDGLAMGAALLLIMTKIDIKKTKVFWRFVMFLCVVFFLALSAFFCLPRNTIDDDFNSPLSALSSLSIFCLNLTYFAIIGLLVLFKNRRVLLPLRFAPLVIVGRSSYAIYLSNYPIILLYYKSAQKAKNSLFLDVIVFFGCLFFGIILRKCFDRLTTKIKRSYLYNS